jgi:hypothetical protein
MGCILRLFLKVFSTGAASQRAQIPATALITNGNHSTGRFHGQKLLPPVVSLFLARIRLGFLGYA